MKPHTTIEPQKPPLPPAERAFFRVTLKVVSDLLLQLHPEYTPDALMLEVVRRFSLAYKDIYQSEGMEADIFRVQFLQMLEEAGGRVTQSALDYRVVHEEIQDEQPEPKMFGLVARIKSREDVEDVHR